MYTRPSIVASNAAILHLRYSFRDSRGGHKYDKRVITRTSDERLAAYPFASNTTRTLYKGILWPLVVDAFVTLLDLVVHKTR